MQKLHEYAGHCRFLWDKLLSMKVQRLENKQKLIWYREADYFSKLWKQSEEYGFLKEVPSHCLQQKMKDLDKAFKDGFDKKSRISQSKFCCISCGYIENADINTAKNIVAAGHVVLACGEDALATSMK